jgi:hypothetical protein
MAVVVPALLLPVEEEGLAGVLVVLWTFIVVKRRFYKD